MDSDQSKIQDGDVRNNESCITSYMTSVQSSCEFSYQIFINLQQLLNLGWRAEHSNHLQNTKPTGSAPVENWRDLKLSDDTQLISLSL